MRASRIAAPLFLALSFLAGAAHAVPPMDWGSFPEGQRPCRLNRQAVQERAQSMQAARALGIFPAPPSPSSPSVLVIRVQFPGVSMSSSVAETRALFQDVRDYYLENSYGLFSPTFTVTSNLYTLSSLATYGSDSGTGPYCPGFACNTGELFTDAAAAAFVDGVNFLPFHHVMVYHAGAGQESQPLGVNTDFIWSLYIPDTVSAGGKSFPGFTAVPENEAGIRHPHGVICHEYGHQIGLPDLYDVGTGNSTLGRWDLMDFPYGDTPDETPHFGAWSKYFLGFSVPSSSTGSVTLGPASSSQASFVRLPHPSVNETFFIEYRWTGDTSARFDSGSPGLPASSSQGMALWRVDESLVTAFLSSNLMNSPSESGANHRAVDVIEADGVPPGGNDVGAGDLFNNGATAGADRTVSFAGAPSGMVFANVSGAGTPSLSVNVVSFLSAPSVSILRLVNYPNPGGDPSRHPVRAGAPAGTITTLVIQLARPVSSTGKIEMDIYDLEGARVRSLPGTSFSLKVGSGEPTTDGKWVYEHDWNGLDDDGRDVASGVYFYRVKADGEVKTGKLAVLR